MLLLLLRGAAHADVLTGSLELSDQRGRSKDESSTGSTSVSRTNFFLQRYNLDYNNALLPHVFLRAGMRVEKQALNAETDGNATRTMITTLMPSAGLTLANPFVTAGIGYDERDEKVDSEGISTTTIRETKNAFLGFRPEGLPTLDLHYTGQSIHDKEHKTIDQEDRLFSLNSRYRPVRSVELSYSTFFDDLEQRITPSETKTLSQSGRVSYGDRFFDDRVALSTNYNITRQDIQTTRGSSAGGTFRLQLFPIAGLSRVNDSPLIGALDVNPALIDGNLTASSGMNIGQSLGVDTRRRNIGLDFGIQTDVSTLYVWVDRQLPAVIANSFVWEIYTSKDNQNWSLHQTVFPAIFGLFDNRFEITFSNVQTRYIMAVTRPLSLALIPPPGVDVNNIFITEIQAFLDQSVTQAAGTTTNNALNSESLDVNTRVHIIRSDRHTVMYDFYFLGRSSDQTGQPTARASTLTNALIANERFNRVLTGMARVMRQNDEFVNGDSLTTYSYEASLAAAMNSLPKLTHNIILTGRREDLVQLKTTRDTGSLTMSNAAEIYPGINASLVGIENLISSTTDTAVTRNESTQVSFGTEITPHRSVTLVANYDWLESEIQGSAVIAAAPSKSRRKSALGSLAYNPFRSLYLFGSFQRIDETGKPGITARTFTGAWSTQPTGGALEFRFSYFESFQTETETRTRSYGPAIRWKINARTLFDVAYTITTSDSQTDKIEANALTTSFKMYL